MAGDLHGVLTRECARSTQHRQEHLVNIALVMDDLSIVQCVRGSISGFPGEVANRPEALVRHRHCICT